MLRLIFPLLLGIVGASILIGLGLWQLQRLDWKAGVLAQIEAKIAAVPVALPETVTPEADKYLPVTVTGRLLGPEAHVLTSLAEAGPGYLLIAAFAPEGTDRKILLDLGFVGESDRDFVRPITPITVIGNLHWPDEADSYTPEPELVKNFWFARDVPRMANVLGTAQIMVVAKSIDPAIPAIKLMPVDSKSIPNDHLGYAIAWFSLTAVWLGMTALWMWRIRRRTA